MDFLGKLAAVGHQLALTGLPAAELIMKANAFMGTVHEPGTPLPNQLDVLVAMLGCCEADVEPPDKKRKLPATVGPSSATAPAAPASPAPALSKRSGKQRLWKAPPKQQICNAWSTPAEKRLITAAEIEKQRKKAAASIDYEPKAICGQFAFPSLAIAAEPPLTRQLQCPKCPRSFNTHAALSSHERWHGAEVVPRLCLKSSPPRRPLLLLRRT